MYSVKMIVVFSLVLFFSCDNVNKSAKNKVRDSVEKSKIKKPLEKKITQKLSQKKDTIKQELVDAILAKNPDFVNIESVSKDFVLDMRYATSDNFLKEKVYACAKCYVRKEVVKPLITANRAFMELGYRIKFFDCYRPHSVQKKMWKIYPNPGYVANPKGGSIHNKGAAVDITLVKLDGTAVDMGTEFDYFGKKAHHAYTALSKEVIDHRRLLRKTMEKNGFKIIRTEWWHYNFRAGKAFKISDFAWKCD